MSSTPHDISARQRILSLLRLLIESPSQYTRKLLAKNFNVSLDTIKKDFEELANVGFDCIADHNFRYFISSTKLSYDIKELLVFNEDEQKQLEKLISCSTELDQKQKDKVTKKLRQVVNMPRIGNIIYNQVQLNKIGLLLKAKNDKQKVKLINYKSTNSNTSTDRLIEPFHIAIDDDILHAYDIDSRKVKHFRIMRIERLEQQNDDWEYETHHVIIATDVFKITDSKQVKVHIKIKIGGYNELTERYPLSKAMLSPCPQNAGVFDFIANVNHRFFGLKNFILGNSEQVVEIIEGQNLIETLKENIKTMSFQ